MFTTPAHLLTDAEIAADIAALKRIMSDWSAEGRLDSDTEADLIAEIEGLQEELSVRQDQRTPVSPGGIDMNKFALAMGVTPEELGWDGEAA